MKSAVRLIVVGTIFLAGSGVAAVAASHASPHMAARAEMGLAEARDYLLSLINADRSAAGLKPVALDPIATAAGQKHAEEMAVQKYLSHWNREGKLPDQRYTEAGGTDAVSENVFLDYRWSIHEPTEPLELDLEPRFTKKEIEDLEAAFFNQRPPYDNHRKNILNPTHNRVGLGLAKAVKENAVSFANSMEFVNHVSDLDPLPRQARVGEKLTISGKLPTGYSFRSISVSRDEPNRPTTIEELKKTRHYRTPADFVTYRREAFDSPRPVRVTSDGRFSVEITLSDDNQPGVYFVTITAADPDERLVTASRRAIIVK